MASLPSRSVRTRMTGRHAFLQLLIDEGVTHLFGNPGTTELPVMEVVPQFPQLRYVLGLQESVVLAMADGFARASRQLTAVNLHCTPGLGHAMGALYTARFSGSPIIVTAGQFEQGHGLTEPLLYEPLVPIATPLVKWAVEVERIEDLPRIVHRAAKIAMTPPMGPVFISLPGNILDDEAPLLLGLPTRVEHAVRPSDELIAEIATRLIESEAPVILAGRELADHDAFEEAGELASLLGAGVLLESVPYNARFDNEHPCCLGDVTRNQPKARAALSGFDLMLCLGADLLRMSVKHDVEPLPEGLPVIHISDRDWELGKNYPTDLAIRANVKATLQALLDCLRERMSPAQIAKGATRCQELAARNWQHRRAEHVERLLASTPGDPRAPIAQDYLMWRLSEIVPADAIVVEEALTSAPGLAAVLRSRTPDRYYGLASGGLGFGVPGAVGVALAEPGRPVVAVIGDGSSLYSIQALWTAAHLRLPITYVIVNNRSYRIIKERLASFRQSQQFVAMDLNDPPIDFQFVAAGFGLKSTRVVARDDIDAALREAIDSRAPRLVEVVVDDGFGNVPVPAARG